MTFLAIGLGLCGRLAAQPLPDNGHIEKDLERITSAPDYDWLRRKHEPSLDRGSRGPVSEEGNEGDASSGLPDDSVEDCGYGPAPQDKLDKRHSEEEGQGGGCGKATPGSGSDKGGGCERRTQSCEGCGPSPTCHWGPGLPACGCAGVGTVTGYMLAGLLVTVLLLMLLYSLSRRSLRRPATVHSLDLDEARPQDVRISELPEAPLDTMLNRADEAAAEGDYKTAVGWCYLAGLAALHRLGRIDLRRSATNMEFLETVRRRGGNFEAARSLVRTFEDLFFGGRSARQEHYFECKEIVEKRLG
ncbi:MAG: DUF4129 domain-containing protein [Myxococcota bacterium]|jgi:hypothetical protein|nr:DUF4129 domain-containing protein [Myxococcota bacterium]